MMEYAVLLLLQGAGPESACQKLTRDFAKNEVSYAIIYKADKAILEADQNFAKATGDYTGVSRQLATNATDDRDFKAQGDRIAALMIANGCAPDHVASPETYRADIDTCNAAPKGTPQATVACGYIDRVVARVAVQHK